MDDLTFDFERSLDAQAPAQAAADQAADTSHSAQPQPKNYRQTVCTYWLRGLCMKGDSCGFLHQFDPQRMPVCRTLLKFGVCKEPDCPYKHTLDEIKECNMYKLGFCIYGPACRFKHTRLKGAPPEPSRLEACKPKEVRNINVVANQANEGIAQVEQRVSKRPRVAGSEDVPPRALPSSSGPNPPQQHAPLALTAGSSHAQHSSAGYPPSGSGYSRIQQQQGGGAQGGFQRTTTGGPAGAVPPMQQQPPQQYSMQQQYMGGSQNFQGGQQGLPGGQVHPSQQHLPHMQQYGRPFVDPSVLSSVGQANMRYGF